MMAVVACWVQTENEAAMQQMKRLKLEHAHSLHQLAQENAKLQRTLAHIQVTLLSSAAPLCTQHGHCDLAHAHAYHMHR